MISAPSVEFYTRLNDTLRDFEERTKRSFAAPAKVFIIMGGMFTSRNIDENIRYARYILKRNHPDVPIIIVTRSNPRDLLDFVQSERDIIQDTESLDLLSKEILNKICETPSTYQYPDCHMKPSSEAYNRYEGFITRGRKQYWAIFPEYFLRSYTIYMKYKAVTGGLRVCFDRRPYPETTKYRCEEIKKGEEFIFRVANPCDGYDVVSCPPFYFTLYATDQGDDMTNLCTGKRTRSGARLLMRLIALVFADPRCVNLHQTKYEFSHTGMQCSSGVQIVPSLVAVIMSSLLLMLFKNY